MAQFVALLRGVNVGPTTRVPMADLRALLEELGATDVNTLLNSGNAVFRLHASPKTIDARLSEAISRRFAFQVDVTTRTKGQLASVLAHDPLGHVADDDAKYVVAFMPERPRAAAIKPVLEAEYSGRESCVLKGRELFIWTPGGVNKSEAWKALLKSDAAAFATVRNFRTLRKLAELF